MKQVHSYKVSGTRDFYNEMKQTQKILSVASVKREQSHLSLIFLSAAALLNNVSLLPAPYLFNGASAGFILPDESEPHL